MSGLLDQLEEHLIVATQALEGAGAHIEKLERDNARLLQTMAGIKAIIGNVDHLRGHGPNSAEMRGGMLHDIRNMISALNPHEGEKG